MARTLKSNNWLNVQLVFKSRVRILLEGQKIKFEKSLRPIHDSMANRKKNLQLVMSNKLGVICQVVRVGGCMEFYVKNPKKKIIQFWKGFNFI